MTTFIKSAAAAAILAGFAASAQAAILDATDNNRDINAPVQTLLDVPNSAYAAFDPSTQFDINGDAVIHQRAVGNVLVAEAGTGNSVKSPFVSYDINGQALPSR